VCDDKDPTILTRWNGAEPTSNEKRGKKNTKKKNKKKEPKIEHNKIRRARRDALRGGKSHKRGAKKQGGQER